MGAFHISLHTLPLHQMPLEPVRTSHAGGGHQLAPVTPWMGWPTTSASHHAPWVPGVRFITTSMSNESTQYRYGIYYYMTIR